MMFSCICLTYGRAAHLSAAVACFLEQSYKDAELVILNTMPQQEIVLPPNERVRVINLKERPASLGEARNQAISLALGKIIVTWDDDDLYLPNHLDNFALAFAPGIHWVWQPSQYYSEGGSIKNVVSGTMNVVAFTKEAFTGIGGYQKMNCGEDRDFVGRLTTGFKGLKIEAGNFEPSFIYCWGNGVYHVSGLGDDKPGKVSSWERAERDGINKLNRRLIKRGTINIVPEYKQIPLNMMMAFKGSKPKASEPFQTAKEVAVVLLGRYGDITNFLPMLQLIAERYAKPHLIVSREFASLLEGVSYVNPYPVTFANNQPLMGIEIARKNFKHHIVAQIWGEDGFRPSKVTGSYNMESWHHAGFGQHWSKATFIPVFDRRNRVREDALVSKLEVVGKPMILTMLSGGVSSPFKDDGKVMAAVQEAFRDKYNVVDLSQIRAERIYDLVGLIERASALVSIDTATLHLAAATGTPYVAIVNNAPWLGTYPRGNWAARIDYVAAINNPEHVVAHVSKALAKTPFIHPPPNIQTPPSRRLFHAVERHEQPPDRRKKEAWASWDALYSKGVVPVHVWEKPRSAKEIGDSRDLPYLRDVMQPALDQALDDDIVFWTNEDNWLHPLLVERVEFHVSVFGPCCTQRCDFKGQIPSAQTPPEKFVKFGQHHMGRDVFAATKRDWQWMLEQLGDPILGASDWDLHLCAIIRLHHGIRLSRKNVEDHIHPAEFERGYVAHKHHTPKWTRPGYVNTAPSQKHNRLGFKLWAEKYLPELKFTPEHTI